MTIPSPRLLAVAVLSSADGIAPALQVKVVSSSMLGGDKVRLLVNGDWEPDRGEIVTRSVLFDNGVIPLCQVMETVTELSKAETIVTLHVKMSGALVPTYMVSVSVETVTVGVGTEWRECMYEMSAQAYSILEALCYHMHYASAATTNTLICLLYTSPSPRDATLSRMPSSA